MEVRWGSPTLSSRKLSCFWLTILSWVWEECRFHLAFPQTNVGVCASNFSLGDYGNDNQWVLGFGEPSVTQTWARLPSFISWNLCVLILKGGPYWCSESPVSKVKSDLVFGRPQMCGCLPFLGVPVAKGHTISLGKDWRHCCWIHLPWCCGSFLPGPSFSFIRFHVHKTCSLSGNLARDHSFLLGW